MALKLTTTICMVALILTFFTLSGAARPEPAFSGVSTTNNQPEVEVEENCEGAGDQEECLMRRTLAAHVDYIYTQKKNP